MCDNVGPEIAWKRTGIANYAVSNTLPCRSEQTLVLAATPTQRRRMPTGLRKRLINGGHAERDAGPRVHLSPELPPPSNFPYRTAGAGA